MKTVLLCRGGGGFPGIQAHDGMNRALAQFGVEATHCAGNSAGAIAAALDAAGHSAGFVGCLLASLTTEDLRDEVFGWKLRIPWVDFWLRNEPIRALLQENLPETWCGLKKPLTVFATNVLTGMGVEFSGPVSCPSHDLASPLVDSVLASMSIAGVFPHVEIDGENFSDGGTFNNCALPETWRDFDEVWILIAAGRHDTKRAGRGILTRLMRNIGYFGRGQITDAMLETGLLGPYARFSAEDRARSTRAVLERGWACCMYGHAGDGRSTVVRMLWPAFDDSGALRFKPGLQHEVYETTCRALEEMFPL